MPVATKEERDAALAGFVFSTFRMGELAGGVLDKALAQSIEMAIYDGGKASPEALLAEVRESSKESLGSAGRSMGRATQPVFQRSTALDVGGRRWTAVFSSRPEFDARAQDAVSAGALAIGLAMSAGLFALGLLLAAARRRGTEVSLHDALTQLYNNQYLEETMARELPRAKRASQGVGLVLIDVDNFKSIVDKFGKECGDHVLKEFASMMLKNTRESDIKCRFAGSEFALGMPGASIENARARAEKLREVLEGASLQCGGKDLGKVTLSAGVAAFPEHGEDWSAIVQRAHRALYAAKSEGRNRVNLAS